MLFNPALRKSNTSIQKNFRRALVPERNTSVFANEDFHIRLADTEHGRNEASVLINKMYAWRGYGNTHQVAQNPSCITLTASELGRIIGTGTVNIDHGDGLMADEIFSPEVTACRQSGGKVCEMSKLAFDSDVKSKHALASLFHILYIYAYRMNGCTDIFIEINPRHRRFYEAMLGFEKQTEVRTNPRVNAPAHLLRLNTAYVAEQIRLHGGTAGTNGAARSLYPYFFSQREENGIVERLRTMN